MGPEIKQCVIIGSSPECGGRDFQQIDREKSFLICADGGLDTARRYGMVPDLVIGDFDSLQGDLPIESEIIRLKVEKDDTDLMAAVRIALERGFRDFLLIGGTGGRLDHTYANFCVLQYLAEQGCRARLAGNGSLVYFQGIGTFRLNGFKGRTVSVFPFGTSACTVTYHGLKYPLTNHTLVSSFPLGVSNCILEDEAEIQVLEGSALIILIID